MRTCDLENRVHVGWLPEKVDGDNRFGSRSDGLFNQSGIHRVGQRVNVHEHRLGAAVCDRLCGGHKSVRDSDDFIAGTNSAGEQRKPKSVRAASDADAILAPAKGCEVLFKSGDERSAREGTTSRSLPRSQRQFRFGEERDEPKGQEMELALA